MTDYGHMFVADTNNGRIVRFDENGKFVSIIEAPEKAYPEAFSEYFNSGPGRSRWIKSAGFMQSVPACLMESWSWILRAIFMVSWVPRGVFVSLGVLLGFDCD